MPNYNKVIIIGHLTRDPELRTLPSGTSVCEFGIATSRKLKRQDGSAAEETCFVDCTAFGRTGELVNEYLAKGSAAMVEGRLTYDTWEDRNGGGKRSKHKITVDNVQFLGGRGDGPRQERPASQAPPPAVYDVPDDDENIPF